MPNLLQRGLLSSPLWGQNCISTCLHRTSVTAPYFVVELKNFPHLFSPQKHFFLSFFKKPNLRVFNCSEMCKTQRKRRYWPGSTCSFCFDFFFLSFVSWTQANVTYTLIVKVQLCIASWIICSCNLKAKKKWGRTRAVIPLLIETVTKRKRVHAVCRSKNVSCSSKEKRWSCCQQVNLLRLKIDWWDSMPYIARTCLKDMDICMCAHSDALLEQRFT